MLIFWIGTEQLTTFLLGEAKLEQYLEENPPYEHNASKAKLGLMEAKQLLTLSAGKDRTRATGSMDAQLLLAKLHFACGSSSSQLMDSFISNKFVGSIQVNTKKYYNISQKQD